MDDVKERNVEAYLVKRVKELGGQIRKIKWIGRNAAPDRLVMLPTVSLFLELKRPGKKPTVAQERELQILRDFHFMAAWANSKEDIDRIIEEWE